MNNYTENTVKFVHGGRELFDLIVQLIENAKDSIHLQTYIFNDDVTGTQVADALIRATKRQVRIYVLIDGYASQELPGSFIMKFKLAGVHFRFFEPLFTGKSFYFGRRLHHKVIVIDSFSSLVGGMNIADRYNDFPNQKAWFDVALFVEGEISTSLYRVCSYLWRKDREKSLDSAEKHIGDVKSIVIKDRHPVRIRRNDWLNGKQEIRKTYSGFFREAMESITIVCSYFIPDSAFLKQLKTAAKKGVSVKVVLAGLSDVKIAKYAERHLYRWMLCNNISLYEYQPSVLHAKMAIVDGKKLTIGSYNINNISKFVSIELNLDVNSGRFTERVNKEVEEIMIRDCVQIDSYTYKT